MSWLLSCWEVSWEWVSWRASRCRLREAVRVAMASLLVRRPPLTLKVATWRLREWMLLSWLVRVGMC
jgi:hypothetical protein